MSILVTAAFLFMVGLVGWLLLDQIWSDKQVSPDLGRRFTTVSLVKLVIAIGAGIGVSSCVWFVCMLICSTNAWAAFFTQSGLCVVLVLLRLWKRREHIKARVDEARLAEVPADYEEVVAGAREAGTPADGVPEEGVPADGVPEDGVPEDGVPEDGVPEDGVPEDGVPDKGAPAKGAPKAGAPLAQDSSSASSTRDMKWLRGVAIIAGAFSLIGFAGLTLAHPYGDWDALMIWNFHAKILFAGKEHWMDAFSNYIFWSHPDYPLLLPGLVACCWRLLGVSTAVIPAILACFFFIGTSLLVFLTVQITRGKRQALWALALLLSTPNFVQQAANQCADVPLGFFILSALSCIFLADKFQNARVRLFATAGLMAGFAAWTKNEGLLFVLVFLSVQLMSAIRLDKTVQRRYERIATLIGILPVMLIVICFKHLTPPNDIVGPQNIQGILATLSDWRRYAEVAWHFIYQGVLFGYWTISPVPVVLVFWLCSSRSESPWKSQAAWTAALILGLVVVGYFFVYMLLPFDLSTVSQRLIYSLDRVFIALWTAALTLAFSTMESEK